MNLRHINTTQEREKLLKTIINLKFFKADRDVVMNRNFIVVEHDNEIVGMIQYSLSSFRVPDAIGVGFVAVHLSHRNKGIAKLMIAELFKVADQHGKKIFTGTFTDDGMSYIAHVFDQLSQSTGIVLV